MNEQDALAAQRLIEMANGSLLKAFNKLNQSGAPAGLIASTLLAIETTEDTIQAILRYRDVR